MSVQLKRKPHLDAKEISQTALKAFFNISRAWNLNNEEQKTILGIIPDSTFFKYKGLHATKLPKDTLERISYILGMYKALQILLPDEEAADKWIKKPNSAPLFAGKPALKRMLSGNVGDLYEVRKYLDAQRGGWV